MAYLPFTEAGNRRRINEFFQRTKIGCKAGTGRYYAEGEYSSAVETMPSCSSRTYTGEKLDYYQQLKENF